MKSKYSEVHQGIAIYVEQTLVGQMLAWPMFTPLELRIVNLIAQGHKNQEIAVIYGTTELVIKNYVRRIFDKTGMSLRLQLSLYAA